MTVHTDPEKQLRADIEAIRTRFTKTPELYREVCALMFFRYGITPTANKLYELVRKGSMPAPAKALQLFWDELREKSRVRIEHPDLPTSLKAAAGELTATLWEAAQAEANQSLQMMRAETQGLAEDAQRVRALAESERDQALQAHRDLQQELAKAHGRIADLDKELAASRATREALESQVQQAKAAHAILQQGLDAARQDFATELGKVRDAAAQSESRLRAAETRALQEIDRERLAAAVLRKEIESFRLAVGAREDRHRGELQALQAQLGDLRQRAGVLEGSLQAVTASRDRAMEELKATEAKASEALSQASAARAEASAWRKEAERATQEVEPKPSVKRVRRSRTRTGKAE